MMRLPHSLPVLLLSGAAGVASLLPSGTAEAGRVRFSGGAHISGHVRVRGPGVSVRYSRPYARPWRSRGWGGTVWVGGYYYPRPYYYYYYPEYVPSYYAPVYAAPPAPEAPGVVAAVAPRPELPRFGIGVFAGASAVEDREESQDLGALARFRLTPGLLIEGELARTEFKDEVRVDRRIGGSLIWEIGAYNPVAPYLLGGLGVQQADVDGGFKTTQEYGEVGIGLRIALSRNLHLIGDIRAGSRKTVDSDQPVTISNAARSVAPPSGVNGDDDTEEYTRGRVAAVLYF
jgi:hypothetical protein